jgi:hypothetical protein
MSVTASPQPPGAALKPAPAAAFRPLILAMFLLAAATGSCWQALTSAGQPAHAVAWGGAALTAYAASLLCLTGRGRGRSLGLNSWRLGSWSLLWYGTSFGLATLTWVQPQTGAPTEISLSSVLRALWLVAVGMTLWTLGYLTGPGRGARHLGTRVMSALATRFAPTVRSPLAPWILYAIGTLARVAFALTTGTFGYIGDAQSAVTTASGYQQWLNVLGSCAPLAVAAAALQVYRERLPGARVTLAVLFVAEIASSAASGYKQGFIIAILAVAVPFSVARRRVHKGLLVFAILIVMLIAIPFNLAYRNVARGASGTLSTGQAIGAAPAILAQTVSNSDIAGTLASSASYLLIRVRNIDGPAIIMQRTPGQIGYASPVQLAEGPAVSLIPRALWPGKPIIAGGYQFSQDYYELPPTVITSSAITPVGDLYRHGGWIPVIAGMFLLGCGTRFFDDVMDVRGSPHAVFLFVLLFPTFANQEYDWTGMLSLIPGTLLVWLLSVALTFRRAGTT